MWQFRTPAYVPHASQFAFGLRGSCTLLGLAACDVVSKGLGAWVLDPHASDPDPGGVMNLQALMWRIYQQARRTINPATGQPCCAANGAATQGDMLVLAKAISLPVKDVLYYADPLPSEAWISFLHRYVAYAVPRPYPVLMQVSNGRALRDAETGQGDEADLDDHAIAIWGTQTDPKTPTLGGYLCSDGDNPGANEHPAVYSLATLGAARPISMIAFDFVGQMPRS